MLIILLGVCLSLCSTVHWLFSSQYNLYGVSHYLNITIDHHQPLQYLGQLDNYAVYLEGLSPTDTYFQTVQAQKIPIQEALSRQLVSLDDWRKYARQRQLGNDEETLQFENYEIVVTNDNCLIRPLSN